MYENHRENFGRRPHGERDDRWRRGEERYRREASGAWDREDERDDWRRDEQNAPDYTGGYGAYGPSYGSQAARGRYYGTQGGWNANWDRGDRDRNRAYGHDDHHGRPAYGAEFDRGEDTQRYFTGQQGSWQVPSARASGRYGGYGADYRRQGYGYDGDNERGFFERAGDEIASWFSDEDAARRREEDHRGRGPSGYVRSDERIREDVNDRLTDDWRVDASHITVAVDKGEVTLSGTVGSRLAKRRAEDLVDDISGVKHVQNNLRVAETTSGSDKLDRDWALNRSSTAEGGTLGSGTKAADKV